MSMMTSERPIDLHVRLRAEAPHADESISSAMDRAASLWGMGRREMLRQLGHAPKNREFDAVVSMPLLETLSHAFGMDRAGLEALAVPKERLGILVAPRIRHAYCPICFDSDWRSGTTPYFRLNWGRLLASHCRVHRAPLFEWGALSYEGYRLLPHAYYLPFDSAADLPPWIDANLREALAWQQVASTPSDTHELWMALMKVEDAWWGEGLGDPHKAVTEEVRHQEKAMLNLAALFLSSPNSVKPCLVEKLLIPPHQHRVLGYDRRRHRQSLKNPGGPAVRMQLPAIQARRVMLILTAHTLGRLSVDLRYETGARVPPGRSDEWISHVVDYRVNRGLAETIVRAANAW